jgi:hypothetical protein
LLFKIISGGQTGADQAALDAAIELGIPHGGWIPKGRLTEAGPLPVKYNLTEMPTKDYLERTRQNVLDSDGTVVFSHGDLKGGSKRTADFATELRKPFLHIDLKKTLPSESAEVLVAWVKAHDIDVLNVAGSRASKDPEIYDKVRIVLGLAVELMKEQELWEGLPEGEPLLLYPGDTLNGHGGPEGIETAPACEVFSIEGSSYYMTWHLTP